ncbi:lysophospholipid acyltransferase family protein [Allorhodopirellula heiligendammensis]|uniref:DUF374 domain-containing protein n=1 Tax=Allorhodopirellula heiligendammensis TaxID=2714739 RepID=A0A5C6BFE8_9BACT|nr:lysophospholipid acyltransferase family protein [Allorhodopirellula heiligendammensis]TWU10462.1 hypothetical protein Poly21_43660 [Allorhodopirellula heiligendammensis]
MSHSDQSETVDRSPSRKRGRNKKITLTKRVEAMVVMWYFTFMRRTVRIRVNNDRRDAIRHHSERQFIYALLHAHQAAAIALSDPNTGALVSRSRDGELLVPLLKSCGCIPIRGSSGRGEKGGATALSHMIRHCRAGHPAVIAVDGPKGPRGKVQKGVAMLAQKSGIPIVPVVLVPGRRITFAKAWDRMQLPMPFCELDCRFGDPIVVGEDDDLDQVALRVESSLERLEWATDPQEATIARGARPVPIDSEASLLSRAA